MLAASPEIRAGNWKTGFPQVFHTLDRMLATGEGQGKVGGWGAASKVDGVGVGSTIVTALLDRKRGQASGDRLEKRRPCVVEENIAPLLVEDGSSKCS